jgi:UPF0755 protein
MSGFSSSLRNLVVIAGVMCAAGTAACVPAETGPARWVRVPSGDSIGAVADSLAAHGIVRSARTFERFARMGRRHLGIRGGVYPLRPGTPMGKVLVELRKGRPDAIRIRVRPGVWLMELTPVIARVLKIPLDTLLAASRDPELLASVGSNAETLEGYVFPAEYYLSVDATPDQVWRQVADTFEAHWVDAWDRRLDTLGFTRHEIVTLASIIEGEGPVEADRSLISSVYHNRLRRRLRLQADPTVVYARGSRARLYHKHYRLDSRYNTYRVDGLPPGPIGQPSLASLLAALYPAETEYLYFVATAEGRHLFSRSYREHLATVRSVRASR